MRRAKEYVLNNPEEPVMIADYKLLFGELPSQTLRSGRGSKSA